MIVCIIWLVRWVARDIHLQNPPLQWLITKNRVPIALGLLTVACSWVLSLIVDLYLQKELVNLVPTIGGIICLGVGAAVVRFVPNAQIAALGSLAMWFATVVIEEVALVLFEDDALDRLRNLAQALHWGKFFPVVVGYDTRMTAVYLVLISAVEVGLQYWSSIFNDDPITSRMYVQNVLSLIVYLLGSCVVQERLWRFYCVECELSAEKGAMHALLSLVCDACIWVGEDCDTILVCDQRFDMLLDKPMRGLSISDHLLERGEANRVDEAFARAQESPVVLPTTLRAANGSPITVDFLIVAERRIKQNGQKKLPAWLVGIRAVDQTIHEEGAPVKFGSFSRQGSKVRLDDEKSGLSVPETTTSGRIFADIDVARWCESSRERSEELRPRLEKVAAMGEHEGWLLPSEDVKLQPEQILGEGSFAVVVGALMHGTPVAVKAPKEATDELHMKHIVTMANELRILRHIRHPNIVLFMGACVHAESGAISLVLERVTGVEMGQFVRQNHAPDKIGLRLKVQIDVACALRFLHAQRPQVVHGDLKASNVLIETAGPRAKLSDFGLSKVLTRGVGELGGTVAWMAPEVILTPHRGPQPSSDVFSFGRLSYMLITSWKPLEGVTEDHIIDLAQRGTTPHLTWPADGPLVRECESLAACTLQFEASLRPCMEDVHREICLWAPPPEAGTSSQRSGWFGLGPPSPRVSPRSPRGGLAAPGEWDQPTASASLKEHKASGAGALRSSSAARLKSTLAGSAAQAEELALEGRAPTSQQAKEQLLTSVVQRWNFPLPKASCCSWHTALQGVQETARALGEQRCTMAWRSAMEWQCGKCGVLDLAASAEARGGVCDLCERPSIRSLSRGTLKPDEAPQRRNSKNGNMTAIVEDPNRRQQGELSPRHVQPRSAGVPRIVMPVPVLQPR